MLGCVDELSKRCRVLAVMCLDYSYNHFTCSWLPISRDMINWMLEVAIYLTLFYYDFATILHD